MSFKYQTEDDEQPEGKPVAQPQKAPFPLYTTILIAAYTVVFFVEIGANLSPAIAFIDAHKAELPDSSNYWSTVIDLCVDLSVAAAGFDKKAFLENHQYWRILTGSALHGGILHILFNSYAFYSFGRLIEMLSNRAHLAIVFLISCVGGDVLSLVFQPEGASVGASGGIVGLIGYLAVYAFVRRDFISSQFRRSLLINIAFIIFYGVVLMSNVDNFAHIGGLLTGAIYAFIQIPRDPYSDPRAASPVTETLGLIAIGAYGAICVFAVLLIIRIV